MPLRQIFVVLAALLAIVGAALFILSWDGGDDTVAPPEPGVVSDTTATTSTTTTIATVPTSIPTDCAPSGDPAEPPTTTVPGTDPVDPGPTAPLVPTLGRRSSLSTVGLDEVTFGLTVSQATVAAGTEFHACEPVSDCYRVTAEEAPEGISFVVHDGTIERIDIVGESPITTVSGAGIGTTVEELDELFGERLDQVDLGSGAVDKVFVPTSENDADFRVVFTVVGGAVESMRSGRAALVVPADPCAA